jgi:hemoglobin-like flavoprotein
MGGATQSKQPTPNDNKYKPEIIYIHTIDAKKRRELLDLDRKFTKSELLAHYTPSIFPLIPVITNKTLELCKSSWATIKALKQKDLTGADISGAVYFYDQFYNRLFDRHTLYKKLFPDIKTAGSVLIKVMNLACKLNPNELEDSIKTLTDLGIYHQMKDIRPWQYSVYAETLLPTIRHCIGSDSEGDDVMSEWAHLIAFVLKHLLPNALHFDQVITSESGITTENKFSNGDNQAALDNMSEVASVADRLRGVKSGYRAGKTPSDLHSQASYGREESPIKVKEVRFPISEEKIES